MGIATRAAHRTPHRLTPRNAMMIPMASHAIGIAGTTQKCSADAESNAVNPQVGTQPHQ